MARGHVGALLWLVLVVGGGVLLLHGCLRSDTERARIRDRYDAMTAALRIGDTNTARMLFAPLHRPRAQDNFGRLTMFARPLSLRSGISIEGTRAQICPQPIIPRGTSGHTDEMIKVEGDWFFTGKVSVF